MRSTYSRALTGSSFTAPPVKRRWVYMMVAVLGSASAVFAQPEMTELFTQPMGMAAFVAIVAGFLVKKSMALTPWALVCSALIFYGVDREWSLGSTLVIGQLFLLGAAAVVAMLQLRVQLSGQAGLRPARARWGSVLVTGTTCAVVLVLSRPDLQVLEWIRAERAPRESPPVTRSQFTRPTRVATLQDPLIIESSGLVASRTTSGVWWTHNDSGNAPYIHCFGESGNSCGVWEVAGAHNRDWEDLAAGPGPDPRLSYLYIGDIGDNNHIERSVTVYRIPEPEVSADSATLRSTGAAVALRYRYPDGAHDAEALMIHPESGDLYIVTKGIGSAVYKASAPLGKGPSRLERIGEFSIFANFSDVTGGDISPDGSQVAISTYGGWYELTLDARARTDTFDDVWRATPALIGVAPGGQWEAIAYGMEGETVFMTEEGEASTLLRSIRKTELSS